MRPREKIENDIKAGTSDMGIVAETTSREISLELLLDIRDLLMELLQR